VKEKEIEEMSQRLGGGEVSLMRPWEKMEGSVWVVPARSHASADEQLFESKSELS